MAGLNSRTYTLELHVGRKTAIARICILTLYLYLTFNNLSWIWHLLSCSSCLRPRDCYLSLDCKSNMWSSLPSSMTTRLVLCASFCTMFDHGIRTWPGQKAGECISTC